MPGARAVTSGPADQSGIWAPVSTTGSYVRTGAVAENWGRLPDPAIAPATWRTPPDRVNEHAPPISSHRTELVRTCAALLAISGESSPPESRYSTAGSVGPPERGRGIGLQ